MIYIKKDLSVFFGANARKQCRLKPYLHSPCKCLYYNTDILISAIEKWEGKNKTMDKKMYVGIDMGTNSVGLAVTDENYNLYRVKGKDFWTSRLFEKASTAAERRTNRISRRRRQRETARQGILRELFSDEINKVDAGFF